MESIVIPMVVHILLCSALYAMLTVARAPKVWGIGNRSDGSNPYESVQVKISANLSNQFEWPLFFHVACILIVLKDLESSTFYILMAWIFVAGRVLHSAVQIFHSSIILRGVVFTINFVAVLAMWSKLVVDI
ncbi:MAPEG family protein [uncultured Pseudoteredinibacter sp.]|uniref:MAPEG family protein n=1 Tax=uncultured Pseudoteredinibacter sp. TaxID=1641701 RepID=UPI00262CB24F|nr:MAPEG family protein [uncultured Pseudoteredinibacter sp.]